MPFQKNCTPGPGRPPGPGIVAKLQQQGREQLTRTYKFLIEMDKEKLRERMEAPGTPVLELMIGSIIINAIKHGDHQRLNSLLDRVYGKPKEIPSEEDNDKVIDHNDSVIEMIPKEILYQIAAKANAQS